MRLATFPLGLVRALVLLVFVAIGSSHIATAQDAATPAPADGFIVLASNEVELNGKDKLWQINRITALPEGEEAEEFRSEEGFIVANAAPLTVEIGRDDPVELALGEALPVHNGDEIKVSTSNGNLASFYTIGLIEQLDVENDVNKQAIGQPFPTTGDTYLMALSGKKLEPGAEVSLAAAELPGLLLVLNGDLTYDRGDGTKSTIAGGEAGSQQGTFELVAGPNGATFVVATLTLGSLPESG